MEKLLTAKEAADKLSVSVSAIYKWIDERRIPFIDFGAEGRKRCIRFREQDLIKEIEERRRN